jgi:CBS domain containing-hemolysin-like protein
LTHLGRVPAVGEEVDIDGLHVEVLGVERRRINKVRVSKVSRTEMAEATVRNGAL